MSTYENPITVIDRGLGDLIANSVKNSSAQFSQMLQKQENNRVEQLKKAQDLQNKIDQAHINYKAQFHSEALKSGAQSKSYFDQMDRAISEKFRLTKILATATDPNERKELSTAIQHYNDQITVGTQTAENLRTWKESGEGSTLAGLKNEIGGIYTGIYDEESDDDFAKQVGRSYFLKLALSGMAVRDGKPAGNPIFFMRNINGIPTQYAYLESEGIEKAFNVNEVMQESLAEIMDMDKNVTERGANGQTQTYKGFDGIIAESGIKSRDGLNVSKAYLMTDEEGLPIVKGVVKDIGGGKIQTNLVQLANIPAMIEAVGPTLQNYINAKTETVENFAGYADVNATYLEYASKLSKEQLQAIGIDKVQNLSYEEGSYKLTAEGKEDFEKVLLNYALSKHIKGYQPIATEETDTQGEFKYIDPETQEEKIITYHYDKDQYKSVGNTRIGDKPSGPPPKFNKRQTRDINNSVKAFTDGKVQGNDFVKGMTIDGEKVSDFRFKDGKLTFLYEPDPIIVTEENKEKYKDSEIGEEIIKEIPIKGYDEIKPTRNQLEPIVKNYIKKQYDLEQKERSKLINQIVEELIKGQTDSTNITRGNKNNLPTGVTTFTNNPLVKK